MWSTEFYADDMTLQIVIERGEDGYFVARCPSLRSCWSQGRTREEAIGNIREAIELYLEPSPEQPSDGKNRELVAITL